MIYFCMWVVYSDASPEPTDARPTGYPTWYTPRPTLFWWA